MEDVERLLKAAMGEMERMLNAKTDIPDLEPLVAKLARCRTNPMS